MLISLPLLLALATSAPAAQIPLHESQPKQPNRKHGLPGIDATFDYVVAGGGTAGITIASRLAESNLSVALVEAGDYYEYQSLTSVPAADSLGVGASPSVESPIDWGFVARSVPGANHRDVHYARGKCLGGSSALNFMVYQRPTRESMQLWADLVDDQSYTLDKAFPYYKRTVKFTPPKTSFRFSNATAEFSQEAFSEDGQPLQVSYPNFAMPFSSWMKDGLKSICINETRDFNSGDLFGAQYCSCTIAPSDESRSSSQAAFLNPGLVNLLPLTIYRNTLAKRIMFDKQKRAVGVRVRSGTFEYILNATREVIVSAGAFQSPQILMVSGIGPRDTLEKHGIEVLSDLPGVGQSMQDHVFFGPTYRVALTTFTKLATDFEYLGEQLLTYLATQTGVLTNPVTDFIAFEKIPDNQRTGFSTNTKKDLAQIPADWPEVEVSTIAGLGEARLYVQYLSAAAYVGNFSEPFRQQPNDGHQYAGIVACLVAPTSRGNVTIRSSDTNDLPIISPNWLATQTDQQVGVAAFKRIRSAFHGAAMAPIVIGDEYDPGVQYQTDAEILQAIRNSVMTIYHASCTCKMGTRRDPMAVLDNRARVFGVEALRVVDVSAFPVLVPGHPQSTVYMLAEKIADDIIST